LLCVRQPASYEAVDLVQVLLGLFGKAVGSSKNGAIQTGIVCSIQVRAVCPVFALVAI
jgi:hypothetical protein